MFKRLIPYFLLFTISLIPRFISLGTVPASLSHDEVDLIIQAHSVKLTGHDLSGTWSPWFLLPNDAVMAELGPIINLPALSLLPNTLWSAHITSAILGSLYVVIIVLLLLSWGMPSSVAWLSGFLLALSPWHILFSRTTLEQPTSLFFYTLSWLSLSTLFNAKNKKTFFLSTFYFTICYLLGFYTYHGYKFALPLLTLVVTVFNYVRSRQEKRGYILTMIILIIGSFYLRTYLYQDSYISRQSEIVFLDKSKFIKEVDTNRSINLLPPKINELLTNKPQAMLSYAAKKYLSILSPTQLFMTGEKNGVFATGRTGYLYLFLLPFVLIGFVTMLASAKKIDLLILCLLTLSPLATILHNNDSFAFRSGIFIVLLTITASIGIVYLNKQFPKFKITIAAMFLTVISFMHFSYVYIGYYPVESARAYFFHDRILATYLSHRGDEKILVIDPQPRYIMSYLVLTNDTVTNDTIKPLISNYSVSEEKNNYQLGNLTIRRDCPDDLRTYTTIVVDSTLEASLSKCSVFKELSSPHTIRKIADPVDSGGNKIIYNDQVCSDVTLPRYLNLTGINSFALQEMSRVQFCSSWIIEN